MLIYVETPLSAAVTPELFKEFPFNLMSGTQKLNFFHSEMHQVATLRRKYPDPLVEIHSDSAAGIGYLNAPLLAILKE